MITFLDKAMSLKNLRSSRPSGQIATLLILIMVVVLIFILVTANIGQISLTTTNLANAADSASLYLSSQLGTKSRMLWEALGNRVEQCKSRGLLGAILAIVVAVVVIVVAPYAFPSLAQGYTAGIGSAISFAGSSLGGALVTIGAGTAGGALGGFAGTGTLQGAVQGAMIGASIGGAFVAAGNLLSPTDVTGNIPLEARDVWGIPLYHLPSAGAVTLANSLIPLTAASSIYNAYVADRMTAAALSAAAKAINGLPEEDRFRESVFLMALSQTIDDPNTTPDIFDSDADGDVTEKIPNFQYWWDMRTADFRDNITTLRTLIDDFFTGPLKAFQDFAQAQYSSGGALDRIELQETERSPDHWDGVLVKLVRALEGAGYDLSFWKPGLPPEDRPECERCDPEYLDEIDQVASKLKEIVTAAEGLRTQSLDQLAVSWEDWLKFFYDEEADGDYYDILQRFVAGSAADKFEGLTAWKEEIKSKRLLLSECAYGPCGADGTGSADWVCNPPCRIKSYSGHPYPGTIDNNADDEFDPARDAVTTIIDRITTFRSAVRDFYNNMNNAANDEGTAAAYGGKNPATYTWTDSRGTHSVKVETHFPIPRLASYSKGPWYDRESCIGIRDYAGSPTVEITRTDPVGKNMGILGMWNPFFNGKVIRKSVGSYSFDRAAIGGK